MPEGSIVENEDGAIVELRCAVLLRYDGGIEVPDCFPGFSGDDDDGGDTSKGSEDVAVFEGIYGVDKRPVLASIVGLERKYFGIEVIDDLP